jgi:hypothetical protein
VSKKKNARPVISVPTAISSILLMSTRDGALTEAPLLIQYQSAPARAATIMTVTLLTLHPRMARPGCRIK